jgi:hypothetical protein
MPKALMLALVFLLSGAWLTAQSNSQTGSKDSGAASGQTTIQGCLQESNGTYTLSSDSGMMYQLQGDSAILSKHTGHEVRVTGSTSGAGDSSNAMSPNAGASGSSGQTLTVTHLKHISKTCTNANTSK